MPSEIYLVVGYRTSSVSSHAETRCFGCYVTVREAQRRQRDLGDAHWDSPLDPTHHDELPSSRRMHVRHDPRIVTWITRVRMGAADVPWP